MDHDQLSDVMLHNPKCTSCTRFGEKEQLPLSVKECVHNPVTSQWISFFPRKRTYTLSTTLLLKVKGQQKRKDFRNIQSAKYKTLTVWNIPPPSPSHPFQCYPDRCLWARKHHLKRGKKHTFDISSYFKYVF